MRVLATIALLLVGVSVAVAQKWPTRSMTLVVPFAAGGSSDAIGRIVADGLSKELGQPVVVENVTGAAGMAGGSCVARALADGYQFVIGNVGSFAQSQWLYQKPPYDVLKDFAPVALITDEFLFSLPVITFLPIASPSSGPMRRQTRPSFNSTLAASAAPII